MTTYYTDEGAFDLPEVGFADETVNRFSAPIEGGGEIGLVIARAKLPKDRSLEEMVSSQIEQEAKTLRGFAVLERIAAVVAGVVAIDVASRYRNGSEMAYQRQLHFVAYGRWILVGSSSPLTARDACDETLAHVIGTFRLRER